MTKQEQVAAWADTIVSETDKVKGARTVLLAFPSPGQKADAITTMRAALNAMKEIGAAAVTAGLNVELAFELGRRGYGQ